MTESLSKANDEVVRRNARHELVVGLVLLGLALFMYFSANAITLDEDEAGLGPRFFPQMICIAMGAIGLVLAVQGARGRCAPGDSSEFSFGEFLTIALPLTLISIAYLWLFNAFGYLVSTVITLYVAFIFFGVRGLKLLILPPIVAGVFYVAFFHLLGIFEPPAQIFDIKTLFSGE